MRRRRFDEGRGRKRSHADGGRMAFGRDRAAGWLLACGNEPWSVRGHAIWHSPCLVLSRETPGSTCWRAPSTSCERSLQDHLERAADLIVEAEAAGQVETRASTSHRAHRDASREGARSSTVSRRQPPPASRVAGPNVRWGRGSRRFRSVRSQRVCGCRTPIYLCFSLDRCGTFRCVGGAHRLGVLRPDSRSSPRDAAASISLSTSARA